MIDVWETLVNPQRDVSATFIHGITASMVASAPVFDEIAGDLAVRLDGACLVAHNLPFDYRMLSGEYERLGADLALVSGIDTLNASGRRLSDACDEYGITLDGAHRAVNDALATAQLVVRLADRCTTGSALAAPVGLHRSGLVLRRDDTAPEMLPEQPFITQLISRLDYAQAEAQTIAYLELVERALSDLHLDRDERVELASSQRNSDSMKREWPRHIDDSSTTL